MSERLIIIDGNSLVNRAYFALPKLTNSKGLHTNAILGFTRMLLRIIEEDRPDYLVVAFDVRAKTFRHLQYEEYKGTRKGMPDELAMQMPPLKRLLDSLGISRVELAGYEADDLIGTITHRAKNQGIDSLVFSGDKDILQLVGDRIEVAITKKGISQVVRFDRETVLEEMGVHPEQIIDYKALAGDSSDNIPGVKGIGAKTAVKLISHYGPLESIYENLETVEPVRIRNLLGQYREDAVISKKLATIVTDMPVEMDLEDYRFGAIDRDSAYEVLIDLEMGGLIKTLGYTESDAADESTATYVLAENPDFAATIEKIRKRGEMTFKTLSVKRDPTDYGMVALAILDGHEVRVFDDPVPFKALLEDPTIGKIGYMLKEDYLALRSSGILLAGMREDLLISHYLLYPDRNSHEIEKISLHLLNYEIPSIGMMVKAEKTTFDDLSVGKKHDYLKNVLMLVDSTRESHNRQMEEQDLTALYREVEIPLIEVLGNMEYVGFRVDQEQLDAMDGVISERIGQLEALIHSYAMEPFNINSPKQLGTVLFEKLGLRVIKKTKTGYSTNHDVLMKLRGDHPIIDLIVEYRTYTKLKSTYIDGLRQVIHPGTGRIHSSFNQTIAVTGRLSSTEPNMQNIPIRLDLGRQLRKIFVASDADHCLIDADYSQIELRILAHLSGDENMLRAYREGIDIHTLTASQVFDLPIDQVTSKERGEAKGVNFGIVYGISDFGLSENLGISRKRAKTYIENYFMKYPKVKAYLDRLVEDCRQDGYVTTLLGRRRAIPEINAGNFMRRSFAERTAMNTPIQGSAADMIKVAMIRVYNRLKEEGLASQLILQVHDELIIDVARDELETVREILKFEMEHAMTLDIPLEVDMNEGDNWYETK